MRLSSQIYIFFDFSSFIFKINHVVIDEESPSDKIVTIEGELLGTDIYEIGKLRRFTKISVFMYEEFGNLKVFLMVESLLEILEKEEDRRFTSL